MVRQDRSSSHSWPGVALKVWDDLDSAVLHVVLPDRIEDGEQRWHAIGVGGPVTLVLVVQAYPDADDAERVRIIGARKPTSHERRRYERQGA